MPSKPRFMLLLASILGFLAVSVGAFGAHALKGYLVQPSLEIWHKASLYHFVHALALFGTALCQRLAIGSPRAIACACWSFLLGTILFSGSLYCYAITVQPIFAMITPLGGTLFLVGWLALFIGVLREPR